MRRKEMLKRNSLRHAEYYSMVEIQDRLFQESKDGKVFKDLISTIASEQNIKLAYRNLKTNKGSNTAGVDGVTFEDLKKMPEEAIVKRVRDKIFNYQPKAVRRVYIPKANGKLRPLGIPTVLDRIVQQCVLQVMEPVCEAKFHRYSYGFRPNRNCKQAIAMCYKLAQVSGFHYVVDVDIKGFFDNVNHGKLLKQIWALGIQDKCLLSLISKMLKAPVEENGKRTTPTKGTPQGGVLSPLLANIVLNELDWWIDSQWANMIVQKPSKSDYVYNRDGSLNRGNIYKKLRASKLKEVFSVRYADDFKLFCKTYDHAVRLKKATEMWLSERLQLETSEEKSKITNLKDGYSEFLGIQFKVYRKGKKWCVKSHMTDKAIKTQKAALKQHLVKACKDYENAEIQHMAIIRYNQAVVGVHEYYSMATMINEDVHKLFPSLDRTMKVRLNTRCNLSRAKPPNLHGGMDLFIYEKYKKSKQIWYINGYILAPVAYCRHRNPMCHRSSINQYTPEGRMEIHKMLSKEAYSATLFELSQSRNPERSIEYCDNRLSRFVAAQGKCEITGMLLTAEEVHCHHWKPVSLGGTDEYSNLRIVHENVHRLIHATTTETILKYLELTGCREKGRLAKVNKWRIAAGLKPILLNELN
jgi:group II intron reverse transcriptase maturase